MKSDLRVWNAFLEMPLAFSHPFINFESTISAQELFWYTDAAKNAELGFGGICGTSWMFGVWGDFIQECDPSIEYLELYAVTIAISLWLKRFKNKRIILFCDNESAVHMINSQSSKCKNCMVLIRHIVLESLICNTRVFARHVAGSKNQISDSLSRGQFSKFVRLTQGLNIDEKSEELPTNLSPPNKIWID